MDEVKKIEEELKEKREELIKQLEEWHKEGYFIVNGRRYELSKMTHQFRVEVLAIFSQIEPALLVGNYGFMLDDAFKKIMQKIEDRVLYEGVQISKRPKHWEEFEEDYIDFVNLSMKVITYPFYKKKLLTN